MEERFEEFFKNKNYIRIKNSLFNYASRKTEIKSAFLEYNKKAEKFLDIGSGISPVSPVLKETLFMDLSIKSINFLKKQGHNAKVGSITKIPLKDNEFDWIFCSEVLEHIKDYKKAIKELSRVVKKGGKIIITVPVHIRYWHSDDEFVGHYRRFNPKELRKDLEKSELKILEEKPIGSIIERYLTLFVVKSFKSSNKPITESKVTIIIFVNKILYLIVRASLLFNSKKSTSIMLYVCEKV